jgi:hypothetical protein
MFIVVLARNPTIVSAQLQEVVHFSTLCFFRLTLKILPLLDLQSGLFLSYLTKRFIHFSFLHVF